MSTQLQDLPVVEASSRGARRARLVTVAVSHLGRRIPTWAAILQLTFLLLTSFVVSLASRRQPGTPPGVIVAASFGTDSLQALGATGDVLFAVPSPGLQRDGRRLDEDVLRWSVLPLPDGGEPVVVFLPPRARPTSTDRLEAWRAEHDRAWERPLYELFPDVSSDAMQVGVGVTAACAEDAPCAGPVRLHVLARSADHGKGCVAALDGTGEPVAVLELAGAIETDEPWDFDGDGVPEAVLGGTHVNAEGVAEAIVVIVDREWLGAGATWPDGVGEARVVRAGAVPQGQVHAVARFPLPARSALDGPDHVHVESLHAEGAHLRAIVELGGTRLWVHLNRELDVRVHVSDAFAMAHADVVPWSTPGGATPWAWRPGDEDWRAVAVAVR